MMLLIAEIFWYVIVPGSIFTGMLMVIRSAASSDARETD